MIIDALMKAKSRPTQLVHGVRVFYVIAYFVLDNSRRADKPVEISAYQFTYILHNGRERQYLLSERDVLALPNGMVVSGYIVESEDNQTR